MHLTGVAVLLASVLAVLPAAAQTMTVPVGRYADFRQLLARETPAGTAEIAMTIRYPDGRKDRQPAIVIVHTLGGYQEANEGWHEQAFRQQGLATLTYASDAQRRLRAGDFASGWPSAVAEAYAALRLLAGQPGIDAGRIAIVGFSFGGEVAWLSAFERLRAALAPDGLRFAAHVATYPAGVHAPVAEPGSLTGAPILMLLGEKDDNLPVPKVMDYLAYARSAGVTPFDVKVYPGAYHAWTVSTLGAPQFYGQYDSTRKCPYVVMGPTAPMLLIGGKLVAIDPAVMRTCTAEGRGYTMGYDEKARAASLRDTLDFLKATLRP